MAEQQGRKMQLRIIDCKPVYHGTNNKGDDYTIHEVRASKTDGTLINEKLRSFTALPVGQTIEVTVVPYKSKEYGKSFTLYPSNQKSAGTTAAVNDLGEQVKELQERSAKLSQRVSELERIVGEMLRDEGRNVGAVIDAAMGAPAAPAAPAQDPALVASLDERFGADAPFE